MISWDGFHNTRDLGGLPTVTGTVTRHGRLIRSADLRFVTSAGWAAAQASGVRAVIDLRNADEVTPGARSLATLGAGMFTAPAARAEVPPPPDIAVALVPLDDVGDVALWQRLNADGLNGTPLYYRPFLDAKPGPVAAVLSAIARVRDGGVIFHCGAGRDRTGLIAILLLALADVTPEAIAADYALSYDQLPALFATLGRELGEVDTPAYLAARGTSAHESITGLLRDTDVAEYLAAAGVTGTDIDSLRARLR